MQRPLTQFPLAPHAMPQPPQFMGSREPLLHVSAQRVSVQVAMQKWPSQSGVEPEHVMPQLPQFDAVDRLASQPLRGLPSQSPYPGTH